MKRKGTTRAEARRIRLCRGPLLLSLLVHAVGLGAALVWAAQHEVDARITPIGALALRAAPEEPQAVPDNEVLEPLLLEEDLPDLLDEVVFTSDAVEFETPFEDDAQDLDCQPPAFHEVPLTAARGRQPPAPPQPVARVEPVRPAPPAPRPTIVRIRPRPAPPSPPRVAPSPARRSPLRVVWAPDPRRYYPDSMQRRGIGGRAWVRLWIDAQGRVTATRIETSTGSTQLDDAAVSLAYAYRFSRGAGMRTTRLPVTFRPPRGSYGP
ncbi:MAG: energy transducer TonB [Planctomycetota bacterium]|nr:energy transducer TonB [Planctomycetota bacterium]